MPVLPDGDFSRCGPEVVFVIRIYEWIVPSHVVQIVM